MYPNLGIESLEQEDRTRDEDVKKLSDIWWGLTIARSATDDSNELEDEKHSDLQ